MADEFLINSYADQWQRNSDITRLADGSVLVVWDSFYSEGGDSYYYIAAQRYSATGETIGGEMLLDDDVFGQSTHPSVVALADGGFAVAWETARGSSILDQTDIYTRAYDADGAPRGDSIVAHRPNQEDQYAASITATANGGYTLTWSSYGGSDIDVGDEIFTQRFDADGGKLGLARQVDQFNELDQNNSRATALANGNVLITWESEYAGHPNPGFPSNAVSARLYRPDGRPLTDEFVIVDQNDGMADGIGLTESSVDVAALPDGRFVISWYQTVRHDDSDTSYEIRARLHAANGDPIGQDIIVRSSTESVPKHSAVAALDGGGFVVAWDAVGGNANAFEEVFARVYDDDGNAISEAFVVNPPSGQSSQENPEIQALDGGGFLITYESEFLDGDDDAIAGRILGQGTDRADRDTMLWTGSWHALGGNDLVVGTTGADTIHLDAGNDRARGGGGDDILIGGLGADRLNGGAGSDVFVYASAAESTPDAGDRITGFRSRQDTIDLSAIDAVPGAGNQAFDWIGGAAFSGTAGELRFAWGVLTADLDGDSVADFAITLVTGTIAQADLIL